ncbi:MAG: TetR family transcriptional regulator [Actinobacteria bacterium]|nr:TetR family transcriptional regulator [Actinomycetota bacterium]
MSFEMCHYSIMPLGVGNKWLNRDVREIHPTKARLTEVAASLIDEHGSQGFTVEQLLDTSQISKGSLYHHFEDFHDVIMQAQVMRFARYVDEDIEILTRVLLSSESRDDMLTRLDAVSRATHDPARTSRRGDRVEILAGARHSQRMKEALGPTQAHLTSAIADLVREMQVRHFVTQDLDPNALAVFIQAYSLGLIVNDVSSEQIDLEKWHAMISRMTRGLL